MTRPQPADGLPRRKHRRTTLVASVDEAWLKTVPEELHEVVRSLPPMCNTYVASQICGCSEATIRKRVQTGELRGIRSRGGSSPVLVPRTEIVKWLVARTEASF